VPNDLWHASEDAPTRKSEGHPRKGVIPWIARPLTIPQVAFDHAWETGRAAMLNLPAARHTTLPPLTHEPAAIAGTTAEKSHTAAAI